MLSLLPFYFHIYSGWLQAFCYQGYYGFVYNSSESIIFLFIFLELVALSGTKFVPRISAFLSCFLEWVYMYPYFLRGRKEDKLGVSTWMAMRLQVFQQCINALLTLHNFTLKSCISNVFKNCNNTLPYLADKLIFSSESVNFTEKKECKCHMLTNNM